ncbi:hypothetical protein GHI93_07575 [Lactococcus hircilactis]|uniref:Uncharacterized protein n=1 Tax=Lactococcus hircilactis TaxID=1494462 RepID=A0A7X1Z8N7_9LACT|nr:hypothetical protein [Lactococcus hircilactis]
MVRNIFITNDNRDNISIYEKEPVYVVNFECQMSKTDERENMTLLIENFLEREKNGKY